MYKIFNPSRGSNRGLLATQTTQYLPLAVGDNAVRIVNKSTIIAFFVTFNSTDEPNKVCTENEFPIYSESFVIGKPTDHDMVAILSSSATSPQVYIQSGRV